MISYHSKTMGNASPKRGIYVLYIRYWWNSGLPLSGGDRFDLMTYDSKYWGQRVKARGGEAERRRVREKGVSRRAMTLRSDAPFGCSLKHTSFPRILPSVQALLWTVIDIWREY